MIAGRSDLLAINDLLQGGKPSADKRVACWHRNLEERINFRVLGYLLQPFLLVRNTIACPPRVGFCGSRVVCNMCCGEAVALSIQYAARLACFAALSALQVHTLTLKEWSVTAPTNKVVQ